MTWEDIVYDPGSTTKAFKGISSDYKLELLFSDFDQNIYKRAIIIKLDDIPVMLAVSETNELNDKFLEILQNAQTRPIGEKLFAAKSGIKRGVMTVDPVTVDDIEDSLALDYIHALGVENGIFFRKSTFFAGAQTMDLKEYVLPGLKHIVKHSKK